MNFDLTEDQLLLKALVERFVTDCYGGDLTARRAARCTPAGYAAANWARLADSGVLALAVSDANGGLGGGVGGGPESGPGSGRTALITAMEVLGHGLVAEPVIDVAVIAAGLLDAAGETAVLADVMAGTQVVVLAHAERAARYDLGHVGATATLHGGGVVIDGTKVAVMAGAAADMLIVSARGSDGIGLWLVAADAAGVDRRCYRLADGSAAAEIVFRGVVAGQRLGGIDLLWPVAATARLAAAAEMLGLMTLLFDSTLAYVKARNQFGQPLGGFQVIQHRMTDAYVLCEQARSQVIRAALAPGDGFAQAAAGAKAFVAEAALTVAHTAVQMHGGMGITDELNIGHALKRIRVLALTFGDNDTAIDDYRKAG